VQSHAAARPQLAARTLDGLREGVHRLYTSANPAISLLLAVILAATAFIANGGLQLGSSTLVEVGMILIGAALAAGAVVLLGFEARLHGGVALASLAALAGLTALSIAWSLHPSESWVETNRTLAYVAVFASGIGAVRIARERWASILAGVLLALLAISLWGLATKVAPAWLAADETYARLREPYGYWNAVGLTAAMAVPLCLWLGTRANGHRLLNALAWPLLALFGVTLLLSFSRGSIVAAAFGIAIWLTLVPLRLQSLAVLVPSGLATAAVTAWAFGRSALTDDRVALADRKDAGLELGLILLAMIVLLLAAGFLIQLRAERHPLPEPTRRRIGGAAIALLAAAPVIALGALAFSERGITGTVSDRVHDLTSTNVTPQNSPGRLVETSSVRSIYWRRAVDVWKQHPVAGAGAGAFAQSQLRFRKQPARAMHAHGYVFQTLADLGLLGLAVSLVALAAWALAARDTLNLRRGRVIGSRADWSPERIALSALGLVAIVFGVHSTLDWTWFVPAVAMTGLFCAGWVAGRGPLAAGDPAAGLVPLEAATPSLPRGPRLYRRLAVGIPVLAVAVLAAFAAAQPWRSGEKGDQALRLLASGQYSKARAAATRAKELNPLSVDPYFELATIEDAAGNERGALLMLEHAVQVEPSNPETWQRLGQYYLSSLSDPFRALPVLRGALYLDPLSDASRASFVAALRAEDVLRANERSRARSRR
jgi:tetratricopeptide (TPR) repeat protein